jgi:hypothetical protein
MPATKEVISIASAVALTGGGGPTFTGYARMDTHYGGIWLVTITNSNNRFSKGVQVQAEISDQQSVDAWEFDERKVGKDRALDVTRVAIRIPAEVNFSRLKVTHGDQDSVLDAKFLRLSQV